MEEISLCQYEARGLAEIIKMLLKYLHVPYDLVLPEKFNSSLTFFGLPAIRDNINKLELSHTIAICKYIAGKYRPKMLGSAMNEFAELDALVYLMKDIYKKVVENLHENLKVEKQTERELVVSKETPVENGVKESQCDTKQKFEGIPTNNEEAKSDGEGEECGDKSEKLELDKEIRAWIIAKLGYVEKLLKGRNWLVGKQPSIADFFFIELMNFLDWIDNDIKEKFIRIKNLIRKFYLIPEMHGYRMSQSDFTKKGIYTMLYEL